MGIPRSVLLGDDSSVGSSQTCHACIGTTNVLVEPLWHAHFDYKTSCIAMVNIDGTITEQSAGPIISQVR